MTKRTGAVLFMAAALVLALGLFARTPKAEAIYPNDEEVTYKEYWIPHKPYFNGGCNDDGTPENPGGTWYVEPEPDCPKTLTLNIPDNFSNALKAEIYLDLWRAYDTQAGRMKINNDPTVYVLPGFDWSRTPYVAEIPLSSLQQGPNNFTFTSDKLYHIHDAAVRIYYDDAHPLIGGPNSDVTPPQGNLLTVTDDSGVARPIGDGGVLKVNTNTLVFTGVVTDTKYAEFHAYYDGYDLDNDGKFTDWQATGRNNWFPGGMNTADAAAKWGGTINNIGTQLPVGQNGPVTQTWKLEHVVNQAGVKFKLRLVDAAGNVREGAGGISPAYTLLRDYPVVYYMMPNFDDYGLHMSGSRPDVATYNFSLPNDLNMAEVSQAYLVGNYWKKPNFSWNDLPQQSVFQAGVDEWTLGIRPFNKNAIVPGNNVVKYYYTTSIGQFVEKPGPMLVLRGFAPASPDVSPPVVFNRTPLPGSVGVSRFTDVTVRLKDFIGIDKTSVIFTVDGDLVKPKFSGASNDLTLTYTPAVQFTPGAEITVTAYACDLKGNCMTSADVFSFTVAEPDSTPPIISDIAASTLDTKATVSWKTDEGASSSIAYGLTDAYELGTISKAELVTNRALEITGLSPETTYHYQITSADLDDNVAVSDDLTFTTKGAPGDVASDDFSGCQLDTDRWTFINPLNDATLTMTGENVQIAVPSGAAHNIWTTGINAPRIMQLVTNEDMQLVAKFVTPMTKKTQFQGILAQQDANNYLRFSFEYNGSATIVSIVEAKNGTAKVMFTATVGETVPLYMRITRTGDNWQLDHSTDGLNWITDTVYMRTLVVSAAGLFVGNSSSNPAFTAQIDYFFNTESPIDPEDSTRTLTLAVNGQGTATKNPDKATYACNEPVQISATPADEWLFTGWSGDFVSSNPVETIVITGTKTITANFSQSSFALDVQPIFDGVGVGGSITVDPDKDVYGLNEQVTLTAAPATGWDFTGWEGDATGDELVKTVTITKDTVIQGRFTQQQQDLTVNIVSNPAPGGTAPGGTVIKTPDKATYGFGETITVTASPLGGWVFDGWDGDLTGTELTKSLTFDGDKSITATFTQQTYTLAVNAVGPGTINVSPVKATYFYGDQVTLTAVPESGMELTAWSGDLTGKGNPAIVTIQKNTVITGTFDINVLDILEYSVEVQPGGASAKVKWTTDVAADSRVEYGLDEFYQLGTIQDAAFVKSHSLMLTGLDPNTEYHFRITSKDQQGGTASTEDDVFTTRLVEGIVSDDFSACSVNTSLWEFIDPTGDADYELVDGQKISINVPAGKSTNAFGGEGAPRMMQSVLNKDFTAIVKFESNLTNLISMQGIMIEQDPQNFLAFGVYSRSAGELTVYAAGTTAGTVTTTLNKPPKIGAATPLWLKVIRAGNKWQFSYSTDGTTWNLASLKAIDHTLTVSKVGFFGGTAVLAGKIPAHTATVDYFFNGESPISPEDARYPINVSIVGQGTVTKNPNKQGYYCGETVTLTAAPKSGWRFGSWTGDVTGTTPQRTVTVEGVKNVTALFLSDTGEFPYSAFTPVVTSP